MEVSRTRALRGPNMWSRHTAIEAVVHCDGPEASITDLPGFEARLRALFPSIGPLRPASASQTPISLAHVLEQAALSLQAQAGCPVTYSHTHTTSEAGTYQVVVEYSEEDVGRLAFAEACLLVEAARDGTSSFDADATLAKLREMDEDVRLGPSTGSIVDAAVARGVPYRRLTQGSLVQFGWGAKQRRIWAAEVDATSAVSESIAQDKDLSKRLLQSAGVPVPIGAPVSTPDEAWAVALEIGLSEVSFLANVGFDSVSKPRAVLPASASSAATAWSRVATTSMAARPSRSKGSSRAICALSGVARGSVMAGRHSCRRIPQRRTTPFSFQHGTPHHGHATH